MTHHQLRAWIQARLEAVLEPADAAAEAAQWLAEGLGRDRAWMAVRGGRPVPGVARRRIEAWMARRLDGEPLAMLLGWTRFRGRRFVVRSGVLVPQPESEAVVEAALEWGQDLQVQRCADVGCGAGNLGLSLALETNWALQLTDLDPAAVALARANARALGARVACRRGDLLEAVRGPLELVVANLPFADPARTCVPAGQLAHEPAHTLFAAERGTALGRALLAQAWARGARAVVLEIGPGQGERQRRAAAALGWARAEVLRDAWDRDRVLRVRRT